MPKFTIDELLKVQQHPELIRNISVIAHVDHGKTTLTETLNAGVTDFLDEEKDRGITIQSTAVSLYHKTVSSDKSSKNNNLGTLINLIDSPGHVDFNSEVTAALRVTDGALVVVDCLEGVCVQTETVLRQAISERIKPILFLNKLDRIFLETKPSLEDAYITLRNSIESVNVICDTYKDNKLGDISLTPQKGKVGFGSGLHKWGFTLLDFAQMYASKFGLKEKKLMKRLWGNYYYYPKTNTWLKYKNNKYYDNNKNIVQVKEKLERSFVVFVLRPIKVLCDSIMNSQKDIYEPVINALKLKFSKRELENVKKPKDYLKLVMKKWLPCGPTLIGMVKDHLPSPVDAQKYRVDNLYTGNLNSKEANDIRLCNINGCMSMYVSKMVEYNGKFIGFGRVFSGKIKQGSQVRVMGDNYKINNESEQENKTNENEIIKRKISNLYLMLGKHTQPIPVCYAGSICSVSGIDDVIQKNGTLTDSNNMSPFKTMKFSVSAVVKYSVNVKNPKDLPKLLKGLRNLSKIDQIIKVYKTENGENIVAGAGELHLEVSLNRLKNEFLNNSVPIVKSDPIVSICESISNPTICNLKTDKQELNLICCKSPNKLNRLYINSEPLSDDLINDIDNNKININNLKNKKVFSNLLSKNENYNFSKSDAEKIWTFGIGSSSKPNVLVDLTKGEQLINEIKPHCVNSFMGVVKEGVLCKENLRGVRFNIKYAKIHSSREHRGANQIVPCIRKAFYGCQLGSKPILLQPMYEIEINTDKSCEHKIIECLQQREGYYSDTEYKIGSNIIVKGYLPVLKSFGITEFLRSKVGGKAYPQMCFSHWSPIKADPLVENSQAHKILVDIRKRKGMNPKLPQLNEYFDRI